jgi:hypothetical protein
MTQGTFNNFGQVSQPSLITLVLRVHIARGFTAVLKMTNLSNITISMSNISPEVISRFTPPILEFTASTEPLRIPKNDEIVVLGSPDSGADDDLKLNTSEIIAKYKGNPKLAIDKLRAKQKASTGDDHEELADADVLLVNIVDSDSFMRKNIPKPSILIEGVLYQGGKMSFNAGSKVGKTWNLLKLGLSVSEGLQWLGHNTTKTKVLFINFELQDHVIQERVRMVKNDILPNTDTTNFFLLNMRDVDMRPEKLLPALLDLADKLKDSGFGMVIFDPIYKMYDYEMDENSASDVAHLLNTLEMFASKTGASVVYSHHYAKGGQAGKESIDRASGSGVFARDPDAIVNITALEDNDENTSYRVDMQLRCFKPVKPFGIRILEGHITLDSTLKLNNIKKPGQYKPVYSDRDILKVLSVKPYTTSELIRAVKEETGMSESKFYELFKDVKKTEGVVCKDKMFSYIIPACNLVNN